MQSKVLTISPLHVDGVTANTTALLRLGTLSDVSLARNKIAFLPAHADGCSSLRFENETLWTISNISTGNSGSSAARKIQDMPPFGPSLDGTEPAA